MEAWKKGDFSEHTSLLNFPTEAVLEYARPHYERLKLEQGVLLGTNVS
jgi:hypothetical protein